MDPLAAPAVGLPHASSAATAPLLSFGSLTDAQVAHAFDFLPLVQHACQQVQHTSGTVAQAEDAKAVQLASLALVQKLSVARSLLSLLPNIDVSDQEQIAEAARLDEIIAKKKELIRQYQIKESAVAAVTKPSPEEVPTNEPVPMAM